MQYQVVEENGVKIIETLDGTGQIISEADALDLVAACGENGTNRLLIHAEALPEAFYNLRSGLAGDVLQKFVNYQIITAAVIPDALAQQGRFGEMVWEANRHSRDFHVFAGRTAAVAWLAH